MERNTWKSDGKISSKFPSWIPFKIPTEILPRIPSLNHYGILSLVISQWFLPRFFLGFFKNCPRIPLDIFPRIILVSREELLNESRQESLWKKLKRIHKRFSRELNEEILWRISTGIFKISVRIPKEISGEIPDVSIEGIVEETHETLM